MSSPPESFEDMPLEAQVTLLVFYAAKRAGLREGLHEETVARIIENIGGDSMTPAQIQALRAKLRDDVAACKTLIYEERAP